MSRRSRVVNGCHWAMLGQSAALVIVLLLFHGAACAQSFDCDKAATAVEHAICHNKAIGDLDVVLAQRLKSSLSEAPDRRPALLREERRWVVYRDKHCSVFPPGESFEDCLIKVYTARIAELTSRTDHPEPRSASLVIAASDPELCSKMYPITGDKKLYGPERMIPKEAKQFALDGIKPIQMDIDNSGRSLWVLGWSSETHAWDADILFVYDEPALKRLETTEHAYSDLLANATTIFPWVWTSCSKKLTSEEEGPDCLDNELPFFTKAEFGEERHWRLRYLHVTPFQMGSTVYLLLTTLDENRWGTAFVVEPLPDAQYKVACTLKDR